MKELHKKIFRLFLSVLFLSVIVACDTPDDPTGPPSDPAAGDCDRACLLDVMESYLSALAANDPSRLNVASSLKYTNNGVTARLGDGLWETASGVDNAKRLDFADPEMGNVASQVVINEGGSSGGCDRAGGNVLYQVRLKVINSLITEIESMTVGENNAANGFFNVNNMAPEPVFNQAIPASQRMTRTELFKVIEPYMDYLEGDRNGSQVAFDNNCKRYENGVVTANGIRAFEAQSFWSFNVTRRYLVIDEEAGIVWGMFPFSQRNSALVVGEAFKVINGKIMMIQAVMAIMPARAWD